MSQISNESCEIFIRLETSTSRAPLWPKRQYSRRNMEPPHKLPILHLQRISCHWIQWLRPSNILALLCGCWS